MTDAERAAEALRKAADAAEAAGWLASNLNEDVATRAEDAANELALLALTVLTDAEE